MTDTKHTKKTYDKYAKDYHAKITDPKDIWHKFIEKKVMLNLIKGFVKNKKVLDLGCGSGIVSKKIASFEGKVKGIDLSPELIKIAKKENPKFDFYVGDVRKTPFKKNEFDVVYSSLVAHYIKDLNQLFKEVKRILKKGGVYAFSIHHPLMEVSKRTKINGRKKIILKPYFNNDKYKWKLANKMQMVSYHHTFENIFELLRKNDFVVERLLEPVPSKEAKKINPRRYKRAITRPSFLIIKARKK